MHAPISDKIYCDVHGCIHDANRDPYGECYEQTGTEPDCGPENWRKLWVGAPVPEDTDHE